MKVVINKQYGGFGLSPEATLWLYEKGCKSLDVTHVDKYWPPESRAEYERKYETMGYTNNLAKWRAYLAEPEETRKKDRHLFLTVFSPDEQYVINARDVERNDPLLLEVVQIMGEDAAGDCATLRIVEIPDGTDFVIEEYDGMEWVAERHQTWS